MVNQSSEFLADLWKGEVHHGMSLTGIYSDPGSKNPNHNIGCISLLLATCFGFCGKPPPASIIIRKRQFKYRVRQKKLTIFKLK
jgi:hypothetical protein